MAYNRYVQSIIDFAPTPVYTSWLQSNLTFSSEEKISSKHIKKRSLRAVSENQWQAAFKYQRGSNNLKVKICLKKT